MKKIRNILLYTFLSIILIVVLFVVGTKYYVANNWKNYYSEEEMKSFGDSINNAPSLPENFYSAYEFLYPKQSTQKISEMENMVIWSILTFNKEKLREGKQCNCIEVAEDFENRFPSNYHSFSWLMLAHGLEQKSSEIKCLDYLYSHNSFLKNSSRDHFHKSLNDLSFEECIELVIYLKNPSKYRDNKNLLDLETLKYLEKAKLDNVHNL